MSPKLSPISECLQPIVEQKRGRRGFSYQIMDSLSERLRDRGEKRREKEKEKEDREVRKSLLDMIGQQHMTE